MNVIEEKRVHLLRIDERFKELIPPLLPEEFALLQKNILSRGCQNAIITWKNTIIDGHNRYAICTNHGIPFAVKEKSFSSRKVATLWILQNQLGRRNLSDAARIEIALCKSKLSQHKKEPTRVTVARDAGVCEQTVQKYMRIRELAPSEVLSALQKGETKIGTAHREVVVTTIQSLMNPAELKALNDGLKPLALKNAEKNLNKTERLYDSIAHNFRLFHASDTEAILEKVKAHCKLLESSKIPEKEKNKNERRKGEKP